MKKINLLATIFSLALIAIVLVAFKPSEEITKKTAFTGEDLFKGIYFREGKVASLISNVYSVNADTKSTSVIAINQIRKQLLTDLKRTDPDFFTNFRMAITSGNPVAIENCLISSNALIQRSLKSVEPENNINNTKINTALGAQVNLETGIIVTVNIEKGIIVTIASDLPSLQPMALSSQSFGNGLKTQSLESESLIYYIAQKLKS
jgi:SdpC family antimicrobial peptide